MKKIDTSGWKPFLIGEVFEVTRPVARSQANYEEGIVPFVASGNYNNGVIKYCEPKEDDVLDPKGCISVSPLDGSAFYQPVDFLGRGGAGSAILLLHNKNLNETSGLFISAILRAALTKFSYIDQINSQTILVQEIKLPVTDDGKPDFAYMDVYMRNVIKESEASLENLRRADKSKTAFAIHEWQGFKIGDLFPNIVKPPVLHSKEVEYAEDGIPYVVRTKFNNGIKFRVRKTDSMNPSPAGVISFGAENATFFYQEEEFVSGRDIYYFDVRNLSRNAALFLTACLQPIAQKYSYNYGMFPDLVKEDKIKLPVTKEGIPDWDYMDVYMGKELMKAKDKHILLSKAFL